MQQSKQVRAEGETLAHSVSVEDYDAVSRRLANDGYIEREVDSDGDQWLEITNKGVEKLRTS